MARELDPNDLSRDDVVYINDRPWLVNEFKMQGHDLPSLDSFEDEADEADEDSEQEEETVDYNDWTVARLKEEIANRNEDRDEEDHIVPEGSNKPDLVAALEADDEADSE